MPSLEGTRGRKCLGMRKKNPSPLLTFMSHFRNNENARISGKKGSIKDEERAEKAGETLLRCRQTSRHKTLLFAPYFHDEGGPQKCWLSIGTTLIKQGKKKRNAKREMNFHNYGSPIYPSALE